MLLSKNEKQNITSFLVYRWGNILGSSGSIFDKLERCILNKEKIRITDSKMTRFWLLIEDAVNFVIDTYLVADKMQIQVPSDLRAAKLTDIVAAYLELKGLLDQPVYKMPIRKGEKIHENMYSDHDYIKRSWTNSSDCKHYTKNELLELIKIWQQRKS